MVMVVVVVKPVVDMVMAVVLLVHSPHETVIRLSFPLVVGAA